MRLDVRRAVCRPADTLHDELVSSVTTRSDHHPARTFDGHAIERSLLTIARIPDQLPRFPINTRARGESAAWRSWRLLLSDTFSNRGRISVACRSDNSALFASCTTIGASTQCLLVGRRWVF